ncbi:MAG: extracellular solute-binding protein [Oscillospiraceae bacterium]|nr:extracellular solute-binding protein [Oscillospiraceae bacterium]
MNKKYKFTVLSLLIIIAVGLSACGQAPAAPAATTAAAETAAPVTTTAATTDAAATTAAATTAAAATAAATTSTITTAAPTAAVTTMTTTTAPAAAEYSFPEGAKFTYFLPLSSQAAAIIASFNENEAYKYKEEITGVQIEFISPPSAQWSESFKLLIASSDLPDIIEEGSGSVSEYPGGADKAIADGVYVDLTGLIPQNAPYYNSLIENDPELRNEVTTDEGIIPAFFCVHSAKETAWSGLVLRYDWLNALSLDIPVTIADWENVLTLFKEEFDCEGPLQLGELGTLGDSIFAGSFDAANGFMQIDKKVYYGPVLEGYREYLILMNDWYQKGLIDPEFYTRDGQTRDAMATTGRSGAWVGDYNNRLNTYIRMVQNTGDDVYDLESAPYPIREIGTLCHVRQTNFKNKFSGAFITTSCKDVETAMRWLDWNYSEDGLYLFNYGIPDLTYEMIDGFPFYTDWYNNNPDGYSSGHMSWKYRTSYGPYLRLFTQQRVHASAQDPKIFTTYSVWEENGDCAYVLPLISYTADESSERARILTEINTYKDPMVVKFIIGEEPISNFDTFVSQLERLGLDRAVEITQDAVDRYYNR